MGEEIAILGDLHGAWDDWDRAYFDDSEYELLLFVGDLGSGTARNGLDIARSIARLQRPALILPGNNDAPHLPQIAAELDHQRGLIELMQGMGSGAQGPWSGASGRVSLCGFSRHSLTLGELSFGLIAGRPLAMGGGELSFGELLSHRYDVTDMEASAARLRALVDGSEEDALLFVGHNGPLGLGGAPTDPWGCDFLTEGGDWGDPDLSAGIDHARAQGKRVLGVLAGHMHHRTRRGEPRTMRAMHEGVPHWNVARVPRIENHAEGVRRYHGVLRRGEEGGVELIERVVHQVD